MDSIDTIRLLRLLESLVDHVAALTEAVAYNTDVTERLIGIFSDNG